MILPAAPVQNGQLVAGQHMDISTQQLFIDIPVCQQVSKYVEVRMLQHDVQLFLVVGAGGYGDELINRAVGQPFDLVQFVDGRLPCGRFLLGEVIESLDDIQQARPLPLDDHGNVLKFQFGDLLQLFGNFDGGGVPFADIVFQLGELFKQLHDGPAGFNCSRYVLFNFGIVHQGFPYPVPEKPAGKSINFPEKFGVIRSGKNIQEFGFLQIPILQRGFPHIAVRFLEQGPEFQAVR